MLGLVACLNYKDTTIDWDESFDIVETCMSINVYPAYAFMGGSYNGTAYWRAEYLWDLGLRFKWNPPNKKTASEHSRMVFRKASVLAECRRFSALYRDHRNWENPQKIP